MKKTLVFTVVLAVFWVLSGLLIPNVLGEDSAGRQEKDFTGLASEGETLAVEISKAVGVSISPLLGMSVLGSYYYFTTPAEGRNRLPWHNRPFFWGPLLAILLVFVVKDSAKTVLPIPKPVLVPLDALEAVENKASGLLGLVVALSSITGNKPEKIVELLHEAAISLFPVAHAGETGRLALSDPISFVKPALTVAGVSFCFFLVWLVSHTINVLILLCPFSTIDFLLKIFRNSVIAVLLVASLINPYLGLALALVIVIFAYFAASWSFRFMVFGSLFSFDILARRSRKYNSDDPEIRAFAGKDMADVPNMSYGTLKRGDESVLEFRWKPWLILPSKTVTTDEHGENYELGKGTLSPVILKPKENDNAYFTLFRLRPMYKSHEESVAENIGIDSIRDVTIGKGLKNGWKWLCAQLKRKKRSGAAEA